MDPYHKTGNIRVYHGSCEEVLGALDLSVSAVVTDPPYGLAFMGRDWDDFEPREYQRFCEGWAASVRKSMRPGAPLLAFSGTRTFHRAICGIEDAGFTVKDCLSWTYGEGFPKSHDISKAIDKAAGAEREVVAESPYKANEEAEKRTKGRTQSGRTTHPPITAPATNEAETWDGYGTALAPSWEPICYATNPRDGTYAENALEHGVAGLNVDGGRVKTEGERPNREHDTTPGFADVGVSGGSKADGTTTQGRWPANVVLDEVAAERLDGQSGVLESGARTPNGSRQRSSGFEMTGGSSEKDSGGASRFFYTSKASSSDRNAGLPDGRENDWPTVKPTDLMGWLLRLVEMPSDNLILDPFAGSGTTAYVAQQMGLPCVAIDQSEEACELTKERLSTPSLFS
jgi:site-specific DNA-methyltransferase (adenine-specific)